MTRLTFVGDIACDRPLLKAAKKNGKYDFSSVFQTERVFKDSDLVIGNLESCFGGGNYGTKPYHYSVPDSFGDAIRDAGFNLVSTANNHCFDEGIEGLERTLTVLDRLGIAHTGTFSEKDPGKRYLVMEKDGIRLAFYSLTYSVNSTYEASLCSNVPAHVNLLRYKKKNFSRNALKRKWQISLKPGLRKIYLRKAKGTIIPLHRDELTETSYDKAMLDRVDSQLEMAKAEADFVVVLLHIGGQFNPEPGTFSEFMVRHLSEHGADIIIGHHPHTIQKIETIGNTLCAYSLGGFCLSPSADYLVRATLPEYSAALHIDIDADKQIRHSVQLLKCVEDEDRYVHVVEAEEDSAAAEKIRQRLQGKIIRSNMRYYLYADDFGLRSSKTRAIDDAFCRGWIQGASITVNTDNLDEAAALAIEHGYKDSICFHLNLTDGMPLTEAVKKTALCRANGSFAIAKNTTIQKRCFLPHHIRAIRKECEAQMQRFREYGFTSQHIDSHRWSMWNLPVWAAVKPLLKRYGFTTTRTMNGHLQDSSSGKLAAYYRRVSAKMLRVLNEKSEWSGCMSEYRDALDNGTVSESTYAEIYVHPEYLEDVSIDTYYSYHEKRPLAEVIDIANGFGAPSAISFLNGR